MLSIFLYACWPSVCCLWRNVYLGLLLYCVEICSLYNHFGESFFFNHEWMLNYHHTYIRSRNVWGYVWQNKNINNMMLITILIMSKIDQIVTSFANICIFFTFPSSQKCMALCSLVILAWSPPLCCMVMKQWKKPWLICEKSFLEEAVSLCLKELIKDMVGVHVRMFSIGSDGGEDGKEEFEEPPSRAGSICQAAKCQLTPPSLGPPS